ncbi:Homer protein-like protein 2 [Plecturocebus cupreus]
MKRPLSRCSRHAPEVREGRAEVAVTRSAATEQTRELQLQPLRRARPGGPRRCRRRRPARSREEAGAPTGRRRRTRSSRGGWRGCRRSSENRRRSGKVSENKVKSHLSPCQSAAVSLEARGGRERLKTRKTETDTEASRRPQRHLEVEANSLPELLDRKFDVPPDFRPGLPKLGTNS